MASKPHAADTHEALESCRLDIWLFRARLMKSRNLAAQFIQKGRMRLNRNGQIQRLSKSHTNIYPGDELTFLRGKTLWHIRVLAIGHKRGPASEAQGLYEIVNPNID